MNPAVTDQWVCSQSAEGAPAARRESRAAWLPLLAYLVLALALCRHYLYEIEPDSIAYISIARKYAAGNFADAVNAYWSPLFSWLMTPLIKLGLDPLAAAKFVNVSAGLGVLWLTDLACRRAALSGLVRRTVVWMLVPLIAYFALYKVTADMVLTLSLTAFLAHVLRGDRITNPGGTGTGLLIALGYFAKVYAVPVLLAALLIGSVVCYWRMREPQRRRQIARAAAVAVLVFATIALPWVIALHHKYGRVMLGSTPLQAVRLNSPSRHMVWPLHRDGLLPPPNPTAMMAWEDPTYMPLEPWNPLGSRDDLRYERKIVGRNLIELLGYLEQFSILAVAILALAIFLLIRRRGRGGGGDWPQRGVVGWLLLLLLVHCGGYVLLFYQRRYLSFECVLLALLGGCVAQWLLRDRVERETRSTMLVLGALAASFLAWVSWQFAGDLRTTLPGQQVYATSCRLKGLVPPGEAVATREDRDYHRTLYLAYYLDLRFFGPTRRGATPSQVLDELHRYRVRYLVLWDPRANQQFPSLLDATNLAARRAMQPEVYAVSVQN